MARCAAAAARPGRIYVIRRPLLARLAMLAVPVVAALVCAPHGADAAATNAVGAVAYSVPGNSFDTLGVAVGGAARSLASLPGPTGDMPRRPVGWLDRAGRRLLVGAEDANDDRRRWYGVVDIARGTTTAQTACNRCELGSRPTLP